jgi:hypothetical protein
MKKILLTTLVIALVFSLLYWAYWRTNIIIDRQPNDHIFHPNLFVTPASLVASGYIRNPPLKNDESFSFAPPKSGKEQILSMLAPQPSPYLSKRIDSTTYIDYLIPPARPDMVFSLLIQKNVEGLDSLAIIQWIESRGGKVTSPISQDCFYILGIKSGLYFKACRISKRDLWIYISLPDTFEAVRSQYRVKTGEGSTGYCIKNSSSSFFYSDL